MRIGEVLRAVVLFCVLSSVVLALAVYFTFGTKPGRSVFGRSFVKVRNLTQGDPREADRLYAEAATHYQNQRWKEAIEGATKVIKLAQDRSELRSKAYVLRARCHFERKQSAQAMQDCCAAVRVNPNNGHAYAYRAAIHWHERDYPQAIDDATKAIDLGGDECYCRQLRAMHYFSTGDHQRTIEELNCLIALQPKDTRHYAKAYLGRAHCLCKMGESARAMDDCCAAIQLNPASGDAFAVRAEIHRRNGDYGQAFEDATKGIELGADESYCRRLRAEVFGMADENDKAIGELTRLIAIQPEKANFYHARAWNYREVGQCEHAVADYTKAISLKPSDPALYQQRSEALKQLGRYAEAYADDHQYVALRNETLPQRIGRRQAGLSDEELWLHRSAHPDDATVELEPIELLPRRR